jgi:four helix bundle protein
MPVTSKRRHERAGKRYSDLKAWQACHALVLAIYNKTSSWPEEEKYGLTGQIRRAAVSSAVNIAEGSAKASRAEFRRYLNISLGSLTEAAYLLELARDLHLLDQSTFCELEIARDHAGKLTWGLYRSLK